MRDGSRERMDKYLDYYFGDEAKELSEHVEIIRGNIEDAKLGMTAEEYDALAARIDKVWHAAADVRHYTSDEESYMKTNVVGTENMINFAKTAGASFYHISTCSVSGEAMKDKSRDAKFTEDDYDIGQIWENNIYIKSKFLAEGLVFMAKREGLDAKIFRLGRLCGRASDGKFQINPSTNAFYLFMKGFSQIGALPEDAADVKLDVMPIDVCAREAFALSESEDSVFHIMNPDPPGFGEIMQAVCEECLIVNNMQFGEIFRENCRKLDSGLLGFIMNNWRLIGSQQHAIEVTNEKTVEALKKSGFVPPVLDLGVVLKEFGKGE
jgi:thioester reductase-like protein